MLTLFANKSNEQKKSTAVLANPDCCYLAIAGNHIRNKLNQIFAGDFNNIVKISGHNKISMSTYLVALYPTIEEAKKIHMADPGAVECYLFKINCSMDVALEHLSKGKLSEITEGAIDARQSKKLIIPNPSYNNRSIMSPPLNTLIQK